MPPPPKTVFPTALRAAVEAWVRAEYNFRLGPRAYRVETGEWLQYAEDALRKAVTGRRELGPAAEALGVKVEPEKLIRKRLPAPRKRLPGFP